MKPLLVNGPLTTVGPERLTLLLLVMLDIVSCPPTATDRYPSLTTDPPWNLPELIVIWPVLLMVVTPVTESCPPALRSRLAVPEFPATSSEEIVTLPTGPVTFSP